MKILKHRKYIDNVLTTCFYIMSKQRIAMRIIYYKEQAGEAMLKTTSIHFKKKHLLFVVSSKAWRKQENKRTFPVRWNTQGLFIHKLAVSLRPSQYIHDINKTVLTE